MSKPARRRFLQKSLVAGSAAVAGAALMGGIDRRVLASPSPSAQTYLSQWAEMQLGSSTVWVDSNGAGYVKDTGIGSTLGQLIVSANVITAYGASLGAGTAGATSTSLGVNEALACGGEVDVKDGIYNLPAGFTGFVLGSGSLLRFSLNAKINVPNGYTGAVITVPAATSFAKTSGGTFNEQGTPANLWDFISLSSTISGGIEFCWFKDSFCFNANRLIVIAVGGVGTFVTANHFSGIRGDQINIGIDFTQSGGQVQGNNFYDIPLEAGNLSRFTNGVRNVYGDRNLFADVFVYDATVGAAYLTIAAGGTRTQVIGGNLTVQGFTDNGTNTNIQDGLNVLVNANGDIIWPQAGSSSQPSGSLATIHNDNNKNLFLNGLASVNVRANGSTKLAATGSGVQIVTRIFNINGIGTSLTTGSIFQCLIKAGIPADTDFTSPADGLMVLDTTDSRVYWRVGGSWHFVSLT